MDQSENISSLAQNYRFIYYIINSKYSTSQLDGWIYGQKNENGWLKPEGYWEHFKVNV